MAFSPKKMTGATVRVTMVIENDAVHRLIVISLYSLDK